MKARQYFSTKYAVFGVLILVILAACLFPLLNLFWQTFKQSGGVQLYVELFQDSSNWQALLNTLKLGLGVTLVSSVLGVLFAWPLARTDVPFAKTLRAFFRFPYVIPPYLGAIAWIDLCNPQVGFLNRVSESLWGVKLFNIYSMPGLIGVESLFLFTLVFISVCNALDHMDPSLEEAARMSGSGPWKVFWSVTFPLILPALLAGALLVFITAQASFGVPALIGLPFRTFVLTTKIYGYTQSYGDGLSKATALSSVLLLLTLLLLGLNHFWQRKRKITTLTGKSSRRAQVELKFWRWPVFLFLVGFLFVFLGLPFLVLALTSFLKIYGGEIAWDNLTLEKYRFVLFGHTGVVKAFKNSLFLASLGASFCVLFGFLLAYLKTKTKMKGKTLLGLLAALPHATPGVVVALSLVLAFSGQWGVNLYNTFWILLLAYYVKYFSISVQVLEAALLQVHPSLEEAALMSGASWRKATFSILVPLLGPALIGAFFLSFMPLFSELTMSIFLYGPETPTLGTVLYNLQAYEDPQAAAVLSVLIVLFILFIELGLKILTRGRKFS